MHFCMKHLFIILTATLFFLVSCGDNQPKKQPNTPKKIAQREGIQWGEIHFKPLEEDGYEDGYTEEATLLYTTADGMVDSVDFFLSYPTEPDEFSELGGGRIEEEDINFDGIPDLQICLGTWDGYWNMTYAGFVWDKERGVFVSVPNYSDIFNPSIYSDEIVGLYREWMDGAQYRTGERYKWVDGELVKTEEWTEVYGLDEEEDSENE